MMSAAPLTLVSRIVGLMPAGLVRALDAWSYRLAQKRREARRHFGERKVAPLPPVVTGRAAPPHPWYL